LTTSDWRAALRFAMFPPNVLAQSQMRLFPAATDEPLATSAAPAVHGPDVTDLVRSAQGGGVDAFGELLGLYQDRVFRFVLRMLRNIHDAEDVTQDTFVKAWRHLARFRPENSFATWLFTIARRTALNHLRARRPTEELTGLEEEHEPGPDHSALDREHAEALWRMARRLKPDQFEALWLRYGEGFSIREAARIMNTNSLRVRVLLHRARNRMAEWLPSRKPGTGGSR